MKVVTTIGMSGAVLLLAGSAFAQDVGVSGSVGTDAALAPEPVEPTPAPEPEPVAVAEPAPSTVGVALPAEPAADSDHSQFVGRFAVGYMGTQSMPLGAAVGANAQRVTAPVIGGRYWLSNQLGIDAGLGFAWSTGSAEAGGTSTDAADVTVFILHGGVPINLADAGHFSFQIIPELNIGFSGTGDQNGDPNVEYSEGGFLLNVGARVGGEIHFGFMGIPQLSLTGSVGLYLTHESGSSETNAGGNSVESSVSTTGIGTTLGPNPWDLFTGNISALYYF